MDLKFMELAVIEATKGSEYEEVPIGVVIVKDGQVIASAHNMKEESRIATRHAEIVAIEEASRYLNDWRLIGCDLYVTLEPCAMCAGAMINARISNLYFGAYDGKAGCCGSLYNLPVDKRFNHRVNVTGGIMEEECGKRLSDFFKKKRTK